MLPSPSVRSSVSLLVLVIATSLACKRKSSDGSGAGDDSERTAQLKASVTERLGQIAGLATKVQAEPPTKVDSPVGAALSRGTFALLGEKSLADPGRSPESGELAFPNVTLSLCKSALGKAPPSADDVGYLEQCAKIEHVAVIRQKELVRPHIRTSKTFDPGTFRGDALVFHLATGEVRGRYLLVVKNDPQLELPGEKHSKDEWEGLAVADLKVNTESDVEKLLLGE